MKFKVLLIDDEPGALEGMQLWIDWEELGFEVCGTCSNGVEGLKMMEELEPDLVITDVNMPLMNGLEMIKKWQEDGRRPTSFMLVSGYSEFEYARQAIRYGINRYLLKPIDSEEAADQLRLIYRELLRGEEERRLNAIASREEAVSLIRGLLSGRSLSEREQLQLEGLSTKQQSLNVCLIQTVPDEYPEIREIATSLILRQDSMFLIDLNAHQFCIVYGESARPALLELSRRYSSYRVFMAIGKEETSLVHIAHCLNTAKAAIEYKFYDPDYTGVISYGSVHNQPFQYHYDQIKLVDKLMNAVNLLDLSSFRQLAEEAASHFRKEFIAPELVKKLVIHLICQMKELLKGIDPQQEEALLHKHQIPALSNSVLILDDLLNVLLSWAVQCIEILSKEQARKSQGIIHEINSYIREHYREGLTIKKLSEIFYLHPVYLGQLLMKKNGVNFNELLHNLRIEEAVRLLQQNDLKHSEIAEKVGYANYSQFLKQFEKRMRMSPGEYKNRT